MSWTEKLFDLIAPELKERLGASISAFRKSHRRNLHVYVLKAITHRPNQLVAPTPGDTRYDLDTIEVKIRLAQWEDALGEVPLFTDPNPEELKKYKHVWKHQKRVGLPELNSPDRLKKIERILDDMTTDGLLGFHPPNMWVIKG